MSDTTPESGPPHDPTEPTQPLVEHTQPLPVFETPEATTAETGGPGRGRRLGIVGGVAALVVAVLGGAAYAAYSFLDGGGPRPEDALPTTTVALVSIDLDPHAGQKIEAIKTLRKFPALRKSLGIDSEDDLRKFVVDKGLTECKGVDYGRDVKPWVGKRAAFAGVDLGGKYPTPAIVLQIEDPALAKKDFKKLADCAGDEFGYAVGEDYLIASDSTAHAQKILDSGEKKALADDKTFQKWDGEAGDGVAGFYIAPRAAEYLDTLLSQFGDSFAEGFASSFAGGSGEASGSSDFSDLSEEDMRKQLEKEFGDDLTDEQLDQLMAGTSAPPSRARTEDDPFASLHGALKNFKGAAGSLRFDDGGMELVVASDSGGQKPGAKPVGSVVDRLPEDTALVLAMSFPKDFGSTLLDRAKAQLGEAELKQLLDDARTQAGLDLPGDAEDLLGDAVTLSVGGDAPSSAEAFDNPTKLPIGLALHGDPDKSLTVLHKIEKAMGMSLSDVPVETKKSGDSLLLSTSKDYLKQLAKKGSLGDNDVFTKAVPDADHAGLVFFTVIDKDWRKAIVDLASSDLSESETKQVADNLKPFEAFGLSSTVKDGVSRFNLRITTR